MKIKTDTANRDTVRLPFAGLLVASVLSLSGCGIFSGEPWASPEENQRVRLTAAPEDKALVYVYRNAIWAHSLSFDLTANGQPVGDSTAFSYFVLVAKPGKLTLTSEGNSNILFNLVIGKRYGFRRVTFEMAVESGKKYFVFQDIKNWEPGSALRAVDESEGWKSLSRCRLIKVVKIELAALPKTSEVIPANPGSMTPANPGSMTPAKPGSMAPDKPAAEPGSEAPTMPGREEPAKPGSEGPAKPAAEPSPETPVKPTAKPGREAPENPPTEPQGRIHRDGQSVV